MVDGTDAEGTPQASVTRFDDHTLLLAKWVEGRLPQIASDATDAIWADLPAYRATDLYDDVVAHCVRIFGVFVTSIKEQRNPTVEDFPFTARHAAKRVESGITLIDFLRAFRIAQLVLWDHVLAYVRVTDGAEQTALGLVALVMRTIEAGSSAAATTYLEAQQYAVADQERIKRDSLEELLSGRRPTLPLRVDALRAAGLHEDPAFVVAVVRASDGEGGERGEGAGAARKAIVRHVPGLFVVRHDELVGIVPLTSMREADVARRMARGTRDLAARGASIAVGLSTAYRQLEQASEALAEAEMACESLAGRSGIVSLADLSPLEYWVRRRDATAQRLISAQVRAFIAEDIASDSVYSDSLRAYVANDLNAKAAAKALHIHVNTMYYRLERIAARTGSDMRKVEQVIDLLLAVRMLSGPTSG